MLGAQGLRRAHLLTAVPRGIVGSQALFQSKPGSIERRDDNLIAERW